MSLASTQRKDFQETRNVTQEFLQFVAHQPVNSGPHGKESGQVGMMGALTILKTGGGEYESYLGRFLQEHPHYSVQRVESTQAQQEIAGVYENQTGHVRARAPIASNYQKNVSNIEEQGEQQGLRPEMVAPFSKERVEKALSTADSKLDARKGHLQNQTLKNQKKILNSSQENVVAGNVTHIGNNTLKSAKHAFEKVNPFSSSTDKASQGQENLFPDLISSQEKNLRTFPDKKNFRKQPPQNKK